jgi:hypothetical protein
MDSKYSASVAVAFLCALSICSSRAAYGEPASDPCSLLTQAQVSAVLGMSVEAAQHVAPRLCQWSAPNQPNSRVRKKLCSPFQTSEHLDMRRRRS